MSAGAIGKRRSILASTKSKFVSGENRVTSSENVRRPQNDKRMRDDKLMTWLKDSRAEGHAISRTSLQLQKADGRCSV